MTGHFETVNPFIFVSPWVGGVAILSSILIFMRVLATYYVLRKAQHSGTWLPSERVKYMKSMCYLYSAISSVFMSLGVYVVYLSF